jgi:very-short-patch-repair endonuclease
MSKKKTTKEFIEDSKKIHGDKYDYTRTDYINNNTKVEVICSTHGIFEIRPNDHLNKKVGCNKCNNASLSKSRNISKRIVNKFNEVHQNKYDYSFMKYDGTDVKITIICPEHGSFLQTPHHHLSGSGCQKCGNVYKKTTKEFIEESKKIHGDKYEYSMVEYRNNSKKLKVVCPIHGVFEIRPNDHLNKKSGCPICKSSKGELTIKEFLDNNRIKYVREKKFKNCKYKKILPFDFYLPTKNICIEFDGEQHFNPISCFGGVDSFEKTKIRDKIKNDFCDNSNIKLIRVTKENLHELDKLLV